MKKVIFCFSLIAACLLSSRLHSQGFVCGTVADTGLARSSSQPGTCWHLLNNLIPNTTDSVLIVDVNFFVLSPPAPAAGNWDGSDTSRARQALRIVDSLFANNPIATLGPGAYNTNSKIRFNLKSYFDRDNDPTLISTNYYAVSNNGTLYNGYCDTNAINIFLGSCTPSCSMYAAVPTPVVNNRMYLQSMNVEDLGSFANANVIAHEMGHCLGLKHSTNKYFTSGATSYTIGDGPSSIEPEEGCCNYALGSDYVLESLIAFQPCGTPGGSNNMMSQNAACNRHFSQHQLAVMHYNLRTSLKNVLNPYSYANHINRHAASDYTVAVDTGWANDRYFKGNITVKSGAKLTIGCLVGMAAGTKIVVEKGAALSVEGGTITNISGQLWNGIQVEGDINYPHNVNPSTGFDPNHGVLDVQYNGMLSNAGTACMNYVTDTNGAVIFSKVGGIIRGYYGLFYNNKRDVELLSDPYFANSSIFKFCDFKTTRALNSGQVFAHVSLWDVINVRFWGCNFEYAAGTAYTEYNRGMGIYSIDASYLLNRYCESPLTSPYPCPSGRASSFRNLSAGVRVDNLVMAQRVPHVYNSEFYDNTGDAIYMHNAQAFTIDHNYIRTADLGANGVYLNHSRFYSVKNNTFTESGAGQTTTGMYAWQSLNGAHQVYRNNFSGMVTGIIAVENNSGVSNFIDGLRMNCNDFSQGPNLIDIAVVANGASTVMATVMTRQGKIYFPWSNTSVVRNQYGAPCSNESKWFTDANSTKLVEHGCNADAITQPTPQPACSRTVVNVVNSGISFNYATDCPPYPNNNSGPMTPDNPNSETMGNLNTYLSALIAQGEDADRFELGATMAAKLNCFVLDTSAGSRDSLIAMLQTNPGGMPDTDLQLIFAAMHNSDYETAGTLADGLDSGREDWRELLQALIVMYQEPDKLFSLNRNTTYKSMIEDYAAHPARDGSSLAQALLFFVQDVPYSEPRPLPAGIAERKAQQQSSASVDVVEQVKLYPNPANNNVYISYVSPENRTIRLEIRDLLGRIIYTNFIRSGMEHDVPLSSYSSGVYLVTLTRDNELIYKTKLIKQD